MANLLSTIVTGGSGTTPTLSLDRNIASPSNYYNGVQLEVKATSGTAGIGLHRSGFSHVGIYHNASNELRFDMNSGTVILNHNTGTIWGSGNLTNLNQLTNGPGYITGYTESDTLSSVTGRGASTSTNITLSGGGNTFNGHHYFSAYDANGNHYPHYNAGSNANGSKLNLRMFDNSGNVVLFHLNGSSKEISWNGNNIIHSGNIGSQSVSYATSAGSADTFSTNWTNYKGVTENAVAGQLMWKNYGNNHTIFDASNSTSPTGSAVNNTNSDVAWTGTYPTLMGWNGVSTYGVRVDSARVADSAGSATTAGSLTSMNISQFTNNSGYITGVTNISGYSGSVNIPDLRSTSYTPNEYAGNNVNWHFNNTGYNDSPPGDFWGALQTVSPWSEFNTSHRQSQLWWGGSGGLSYRYAIGSGYNVTGWSGWERIITSATIGSQSVSYATTAGSLTSMNISQFTNNSGYLTAESDTLATVTGRGATTTSPITINGAAGFPLQISSSQRYQLQVRNINNTINAGYGWWWFVDTNFNMGFHADGAADRFTLTRDGNLTVSGTIAASNFSGSSSGTNTGDQTNISGNAGTVSSITGNTGLMVNRFTPTSFIDGLTTSNFRSTLFNTSSNGAAISAARWNNVPTPLSGLNLYGTMIAWSGESDTHGFVATDYISSKIIVGGGYGEIIAWTATLVHSGNIGSQSVASATDASTLGGFGRGNTTNKVAYFDGDRNLYVNNPESYTGEVRLGAAWGRGGVYASSTLSLSTSGTETHFVFGNSVPIIAYSTGQIDLSGSSTTPISITGASHKYLTINPGNGYEAMVRYIGGTGSSWYVGKRTSAQLIGSESFHFYSDAAGATVGGINPSGDMIVTGSMRAPIFYDSANTAYYCDPNGFSNFWGLAIRGDQNSTSGENQIFFWGGGNTTTSAIGFKAVAGVWAEHGYTSAGYNTYFTMDSANRGWVFRRATVGGSDWTGVNVASISNTGNAQFDGYVNTPAGYVSNGNPWNTANSAFFPNGITTAGGTNWIYGFTYIGNAPGNGAGHEFTSSGTQYSTGSITTPLFLVNNHSDNTKGYRIYNTSSSSVSAMFVNSSNQLVIAAGAVDQINLNKKVYVNGVALGVNVAPSATAGRIDASNDIVAYSSSDERLKDNITPIENALEKVKSLTGVEFDWKPEHKEAHGHEGRDTGIIAQQVLAVMPTAVRTNDTGYLAVRYEKLIGLLIEGMKEQQTQIDELKTKLDGLTK
jgi:hypothetical protein